MMDENYWKYAYQYTGTKASNRENILMRFIENQTGMKCQESGLGTGSSEFISGSAERNGYQKGDADFLIKGTNIYVEVTGPLVSSVPSYAPLWFRPDKVNNAIINYDHDVFLRIIV